LLGDVPPSSSQRIEKIPEIFSSPDVMGILQRRLGHDYRAHKYIERALLLDPENCDILFSKSISLH